jgi:hypothetical protein
VKKVEPSAEARIKLLEAGMDPDAIKEDGCLYLDFEEMATEYWVRCVPGSLVELEDEKQLRILNQMFIPLSQSMPAIAASQDEEMLRQAARAMAYIIGKQIELSGSTSAKEIGLLWKTGDVDQVNTRDARIQAVEDRISTFDGDNELQLDLTTQAVQQLQEQMSLMAQNQQLLLEKLGVVEPGTTTSSATVGEVPPATVETPAERPTVYPASA